MYYAAIGGEKVKPKVLREHHDGLNKILIQGRLTSTSVQDHAESCMPWKEACSPRNVPRACGRIKCFTIYTNAPAFHSKAYSVAEK